MIKFFNVGKKFGQTTVLDSVNFEIKPQEFLFIVGRSGCGKTTIFRLLNREYEPTVGEIYFQDKKLKDIPPGKIWEHRRHLGLIFQDMKLLAERTVFENVSIGLEFICNDAVEIKKKVTEILKLVSLEKKAQAFPKELSGGELQRVAIARAVIGNPDVILADEPTADLDQVTAWEIIQLLIEINKIGKTVIMATHNFDIVNSLKKRVILLQQGQVVSDKIGEIIKI